MNFNNKCPICLEEDNFLFLLSCLHSVHIECVKNMNTYDCPICRKTMNNLPIKIKKNIMKNKKKYRQQQIESEQAEILEENTHHIDVNLHIQLIYEIIKDTLDYAITELGLSTDDLPENICYEFTEDDMTSDMIDDEKIRIDVINYVLNYVRKKTDDTDIITTPNIYILV